MSKNPVLPALIWRKRNQRRNARMLRLHTPNRIEQSRYVPIGGIDQWITIRGEDRRNPVLLWIHGGPASTYSIFSPLLRSWERSFTIVQWDQRGAGKTFRRNGKRGCAPLTFDRLAQDGLEVAEYLRSELGQPKLILIGSSAGSLTGALMAKSRPDLFAAYVGTDQNAPDPEHLAYRLTLDSLRAAGDAKGVQWMEALGPDPTKWSREQFDRRNRCAVKAIQDVPNMITDLILPSMLSSPDHSLRDLIDIFQGMSYSLDHLFHGLAAFDFRELGTRFELPFFIFQGDTDTLTPTAAAKAYFDEIEAPHKEFALIKNAGHLACFARPDQFLDELLTRVRPLAVSSDSHF
ncbi:alpha/beta fold hydrolase [Paenibacillus sp. KR2-11]|uniref:alpha/beta fold hydrolase n=1 Tax=Paenibacillus sp. KR2-11 TaxID=3385500 RepID=UPI0038FC9558